MNAIANVASSVFGFLYEMVFGCRHSRLTRPFTLEAETYKVCLDCGRQIYYSTERMTPLTGREIRQMRAMKAQAGVLRVMPALAETRKLIAVRSNKKTAAA